MLNQAGVLQNPYGPEHFKTQADIELRVTAVAFAVEIQEEDSDDADDLLDNAEKIFNYLKTGKRDSGS